MYIYVIHMYYDTKGRKSLSFVRDFKDDPDPMTTCHFGGNMEHVVLLLLLSTKHAQPQDLPSTSNYKTPMYQASGAKSMLYSLASGELVSCQLSTFCKKGIFFFVCSF